MPSNEHKFMLLGIFLTDGNILSKRHGTPTNNYQGIRAVSKRRDTDDHDHGRDDG